MISLGTTGLLVFIEEGVIAAHSDEDCGLHHHPVAGRFHSQGQVPLQKGGLPRQSLLKTLQAS